MCICVCVCKIPSISKREKLSRERVAIEACSRCFLHFFFLRKHHKNLPLFKFLGTSRLFLDVNEKSCKSARFTTLSTLDNTNSRRDASRDVHSP